jgi:hypothetical protein
VLSTDGRGRFLVSREKRQAYDYLSHKRGKLVGSRESVPLALPVLIEPRSGQNSALAEPVAHLNRLLCLLSFRQFVEAGSDRDAHEENSEHVVAGVEELVLDSGRHVDNIFGLNIG